MSSQSGGPMGQRTTWPTGTLVKNSTNTQRRELAQSTARRCFFCFGRIVHTPNTGIALKC